MGDKRGGDKREVSFVCFVKRNRRENKKGKERKEKGKENERKKRERKGKGGRQPREGERKAEAKEEEGRGQPSIAVSHQSNCHRRQHQFHHDKLPRLSFLRSF